MRARRRVNWKTVRVIVQILAFLAFVVYFLAIVYPLKQAWRPDLVFQLDPLTHLYLLISGRGVLEWALFIVAIVLLFVVSRIFCGWLCPLGAMMDFVSGVKGRLKIWSRTQPRGVNRAAGHRSKLPPYFDVYLLVALLVLAVLGSPLIWLLDPIVYTFKFLTVTLLPVLDSPLRFVYNHLDNALYLQPFWAPVQNAYNTYFSVSQPPTYMDTVFIMLLGAAIFGFELWQPRFWCRYVCPLGAMCRLTYKLHPLRRRIRPDCSYCLQCEVDCHFGGTGEDDCFYCMECKEGCGEDTVSFLPGKGFQSQRGRPGLVKRKSEEAQRKEPKKSGAPPLKPAEAMKANIAGEGETYQLSRRLLLQYAAAGFIGYPLVRLFDGRQELPADFIRPPGVGDDEARFTELCIKCGQCLKVCLTNGLQPALVEAGLSALWTPRLISRLGYCEFNCNLCGQACPTDAIPKLTLAEKQQTPIGVAFIDKDRCIPYDTTSNCTVCEEHCPTDGKAIEFTSRLRLDANGKPYQLLRPYVVAELCIGCGICENVCPVPGTAAILVLRRPPGPAYQYAPPGSAAAAAAEEGANGADDESTGEPEDDPYADANSMYPELNQN